MLSIEIVQATKRGLTRETTECDKGSTGAVRVIRKPDATVALEAQSVLQVVRPEESLRVQDGEFSSFKSPAYRSADRVTQ